MGYNDPQFLNTRLRLSSAFQDTPNGNVQDLELEQPFYSFTTRSAYGAAVNHSNALQKVFQGGNQISQYDQEHLNLNPYFGRWVGNNDPLNAIRVTLSYRYSEDVFQAQTHTPRHAPGAKALSGPIVNTSFTESDFIKDTFVDKAGRVEDINLGHQANAGVGYIARKFGATENSIPFSANEAVGFGEAARGSVCCRWGLPVGTRSTPKDKPAGDSSTPFTSSMPITTVMSTSVSR